MKFIIDEGIVLRNQPFGESDSIISIFSKHHGKLTCIAKGAKRSKKRFGVNILPGVHSNFKLCDKGANFMLRIDSSELIQYWSNLSRSIQGYVYFQYGLELVYRLLPERGENEGVFDLLLWYLKSIDSGIFDELTVRAFESRLLTLLGYRPNLGKCGGCGKEFHSDFIVFKPDQGRVYCAGCSGSPSEGIRVRSQVALLFNMLVDREDIIDLHRYFDEEVRNDLRKIIWDFILYLHEVPMNTWRMMQL